MKKPRIQPLLIAGWSVALLIVAMQASPAKASYLDVCGGSAELGRTDVIGVPDVGFMAGGEPTAPKEMVVYRFTNVSGEYTLTKYSDGVGLTPPSDLYPLWLAPSEGPGMYFIIHDGNECVVTVAAADASQPAASPVPSSGPGTSQADGDTIAVPKTAALVGGLIALALVAGAGVSVRRQRSTSRKHQ